MTDQSIRHAILIIILFAFVTICTTFWLGVAAVCAAEAIRLHRARWTGPKDPF
jgi:hypothetical protein